MAVWLPLDTHIPKNLATSFEIRVLPQVGTAWWFGARWCSTSSTVNNTRIGNESQVYRSARQSCLKRQDPTHNDGLCLLTGVCRTSPVESLYTKSSEPSLLHRRAFLTISCVLSTRGLPNHICHTRASHTTNRLHHFVNKPHSIRPLDLCFEKMCQEYDVLDDVLCCRKTKETAAPIVWYCTFLWGYSCTSQEKRNSTWTNITRFF